MCCSKPTVWIACHGLATASPPKRQERAVALPAMMEPHKNLATPKNLRYHLPSKIPIYGEAGALDRFRQSGVNGQ